MAKRTPTIPSGGRSDPATAKAARLREIAAKVRQVPRSLKDGPDLLHRGWIALGRLTREAYEAGAWQREGSLIGDRVRLALTSDGRDDPQWLAGETVPKWVLDASGAGVGTLTETLIPPAPVWDERRQVEWEAGLLADEIEREANRIDTGPIQYVTLLQAAAMPRSGTGLLFARGWRTNSAADSPRSFRATVFCDGRKQEHRRKQTGNRGKAGESANPAGKLHRVLWEKENRCKHPSLSSPIKCTTMGLCT
jgi:hypothetical protein